MLHILHTHINKYRHTHTQIDSANIQRGLRYPCPYNVLHYIEMNCLFNIAPFSKSISYQK